MSCEKPTLSVLLSSGDSTTVAVLVAVALGACLLGCLITILLQAYRHRSTRNENSLSNREQICFACKNKDASPVDDNFMVPPMSAHSLSGTFNRDSIKPPMNMFNEDGGYGQWPARPSGLRQMTAPEETYQQAATGQFQKRSKNDLERWHLGPRPSTRTPSMSSTEGSTSNTIIGESSITAEKNTMIRSRSEPRSLEYDPFHKSSVNITTSERSEPHQGLASWKHQPSIPNCDVVNPIYRTKSESRMAQDARDEPTFHSDIAAGRLRALSSPQRSLTYSSHHHQLHGMSADVVTPEPPIYHKPSSSAAPSSTIPRSHDQDHLDYAKFSFPRKEPSSPASLGTEEESPQTTDAHAVSFYKEHANKHLSLPPAGGINGRNSAVLPDSPSGAIGDADRTSDENFSFARGTAL